MIRALAVQASYVNGDQFWTGRGGARGGGAAEDASGMVPISMTAKAAENSSPFGTYLADGSLSVSSSINSSHSSERAPAHQRVNSSHYLMGSL